MQPQVRIVPLEKEPIGRVIPDGGVMALEEVDLCDRYERMLAEAILSCSGPSFWRHRKKAEGRSLLALAQISGRVVVHELDLAEALRAVIGMEAPVPCRPDESGQLRIAREALIGLKYPEEAVRLPAPGYAFAGILLPRDVWHANVGWPKDGQPICLGQSMPAAIPLSEIVMLIYGALSLQTVMIDERDAAGVMRADAARWWQQNLDRIPLTREPFIRPIAEGG